jgi:hypothetical protein
VQQDSQPITLSGAESRRGGYQLSHATAPLLGL